MLALFLYQRGFGRQALLSMLVGNALITLIQVRATYYPLLAGLRLLNGIGNGVVFVLAPAPVMEWLVTQSKAHHSGLMYLGVGVGILGSSLLVDLTYPWLHGAARCIPAGAGARPAALTR